MAATVGWFASPPALRSLSMGRYADAVGRTVDACEPGRWTGTVVQAGSGRVAPADVRFGPERIVEYWQRYARYPLQVRRTRFDVNHILDHAYAHLVYALDPQRSVVTCHDIFPYLRWRHAIDGVPPRRQPPLTVLASLRGLRRARFVITPSAATSADLQRHLGVAAERIRVVPHGVDEAFRRYDAVERERLRAELPMAGAGVRYVLVVSTGAIYKNHAGIIAAFARLVGARGRGVRLLWLGRPPADDVWRQARHAGVEELIIPVGYVSDAELPALYNRADVLLFPSFTEGFGWPALEAMACGLPVVTSHAPAIGEVVGEAALRAPATDPGALAAHLARLLADPALHEEYARRGSERAAQFTWTRAAQQTCAVYEAVLEERGSRQ